MDYTLGIDIGGSTTKIVGFSEGRLVGTLKIKAADAVTSAYGAFGKFLNAHSISIDQINTVFLTGVGSSFVNDDFFNIKTKRVDELRAIGIGGKYLSGLDRAIVVSMGTGTAFVKISGRSVTHMGGSGVGGGTIFGLADKLVGVREFSHIVELADKGRLCNVDLTVGDISQSDISNMTKETTASNFGKLSDFAAGEDLAAGILNLVFQTIGMLAVFAAKGEKIRDIVLTGNLSMVSFSGRSYGMLEKLHGVKFLTPDNSEYATAIGAALSGGDYFD